MPGTTSSAEIVCCQRRRRALIRRRRAEAMDIVELHAVLSAGANFIPVPVLDSVAVSAVQMRMLSELAAYYRKPFGARSARVLISSVGAGVVHYSVSRTAAADWFKIMVSSIPVVGGFLRFGAWPGLLAGYTYLLGRSCVDHYESGGGPDGFNQSIWARLPLTPGMGF